MPGALTPNAPLIRGLRQDVHWNVCGPSMSDLTPNAPLIRGLRRRRCVKQIPHHSYHSHRTPRSLGDCDRRDASGPGRCVHLTPNAPLIRGLRRRNRRALLIWLLISHRTPRSLGDCDSSNSAQIVTRAGTHTERPAH